MSDFLLLHENSFNTGKALAEALNIPYGKTLDRKVDSLIRWGSRVQIPRKPDRVLNKMEALNNASNKERALKYMEENNIPHPPLVDRFEGELLLARRAEHQAGSGAFFITSQHDYDLARSINCVSFMKYIPIIREFRVHVYKGNAFFAYERKCPPNPTSLNIRNQWSEERIDIDRLPNGMKEVVETSVNKFKLDFAGVDIGVSVTNKMYIFELNSACALVTSEGRKLPSFELYKERFKNWLEGD